MVRVDLRKQRNNPALTTTPSSAPPSQQRQQQRELNTKLASSGAPEIAALVQKEVGSMNSVNCATALHRLARSASTGMSWERDESVLESLCDRTAKVLHPSTSHERITSRSLTSIAWACGKLQVSHGGLLDALSAQSTLQLARGGSDGVDAFGIANIAWALATLHSARASASVDTVPVSDEHAGLCDALADAACATSTSFKPQELTNLLWAFATLRRRHARLFDVLSEVVIARVGDFTPQGLSQTLWAYAKMNLSKHALLLAAAAAAIPKLPAYDAQSLSTLTWAFASLEVEHRPLLAAVSEQAKARAATLDAASSSQLLWALTRLRDGVDPAAVAAVAGQLRAVSSGGLPPQQLLYSIGALAKLSPEQLSASPSLPKGAAKRAHGSLGALAAAPSLPALLCTAATRAAPGLTANKLGIAAWGLSRPEVHRHLPAAVASAWREALIARILTASQHLGWRTIGHIEMALRLLYESGGSQSANGTSFDETSPHVDVLTMAADRAIKAAAERSEQRNAMPLALLLCVSPWLQAGLPKSAHVLLVGFDPSEVLDDEMATAGLVGTHWRRFACAPHDDAAAPWPPPPPNGKARFDACIVRWPWYAAGDAAAMLLHAAASRVSVGAPLWLCGNADEGADGAAPALRAAFGTAKQLEAADGALIFEARRAVQGGGAASEQRSTLDSWRSETAIMLAPPQSLPWVTYPGLFAGGGLDVMTSALLAALPSPPRGGRVLDACCGSGAIAAALLNAEGGADLSLHVLDADACALDAAKVNVPSARRRFLCDGWPDTETAFKARGKPARYDWIVSNPPVHRGQPDDFGVVIGLIAGARKRLRRDGVLWMVAQEQVPVGRLLALYGTFEWVRTTISEDGRFVVWSAGGKKRNSAASGRGISSQAASSSKVQGGRKHESADEDDDDEDDVAEALGKADECASPKGAAAVEAQAAPSGEKKGARKRKERDATGKRKRRRLAAAARKA